MCYGIAYLIGKSEFNLAGESLRNHENYMEDVVTPPKMGSVNSFVLPVCKLGLPSLQTRPQGRRVERHPEHSFICLELFTQHSCTEVQWAEGVWGIAHKASATKIKRIWDIFDAMEWIWLVSLQRREGGHRQNLLDREESKGQTVIREPRESE